MMKTFTGNCNGQSYSIEVSEPKINRMDNINTCVDVKVDIEGEIDEVRYTKNYSEKPRVWIRDNVGVVCDELEQYLLSL